MKTIVTLVLVLLTGLQVQAQMPSESLLIINGRSLEAMEVAYHYAALRHFPDERILVLQPDRAFFRNEDGTSRWTVSGDEARKALLTPIVAKLAALEDESPTALILSPDWPTRVNIANSLQVSITGFLNSLGELPAADSIKTGKAISPWFTFPHFNEKTEGRLLHYPLRAKMSPGFYPAAMLSVYAAPMTTEKMLDHFKRSVKADYRQPVGSIVFETNADVRSQTRLGQFKKAETHLKMEEIDVMIMPSSAPAPKKIIGVMAGTGKIDSQRYKSRLVPGSFAEHLTSFAADFDTTAQSKLTLWLEAGAAASVGTVTEPYLIWMKFPDAAIFGRYLQGSTLLEALMQSLASPYQSLIVGDPLCRPWAEELKDLGLKSKWTDGVLTVEAVGLTTGNNTSMHLFVDGRRIEGKGPVWTLETSPEATGPETEILLHARHMGNPPKVGVVQKRISTPYPKALKLKTSVKEDHVMVKVKSKTDLVILEVFRGTEKIHTTPVSGRKHTIRLGLNESGTGPVKLRVRGVTVNAELRYSNYADLSPKAPRR